MCLGVVRSTFCLGFVELLGFKAYVSLYLSSNLINFYPSLEIFSSVLPSPLLLGL